MLIAVIGVSLTSCAAPMKIDQNQSVSGYTLKDKKELMYQKIANKKAKTVLTTP